MVIVVTGSRDWRDRETVRRVLSDLPTGSTVIHGNNGRILERGPNKGQLVGLDKIAGQEASALGFEVVPVDADWDGFGKAAGPIRNRQMLNMLEQLVKERGDNGRVIAFHPFIDRSKGTRDCKEEAERRGIETVLITGPDQTLTYDAMDRDRTTRHPDDDGPCTYELPCLDRREGRVCDFCWKLWGEP
jgi:hypothetical protein